MKKPAAIIPRHTPGDDVYALVRQLSHGEKATLRKLWAKSSTKKASLHTQLFELIAEKGVSDDAAAQKALSLRSGAQFSNLKQHLLSEVLDSLVLASRHESPATQLHFGLMQLQLLIERSHTGLARPALQKVVDNRWHCRSLCMCA